MAIRIPLAGALNCIRHDRRGVVSMEVALVLTFMLVPTMLGSTQVAFFFRTQSRLDTALQAGLQNIWATGTTSYTAIKAAANANWGSSGPTLTVASPVAAYYCNASNGTHVSGPTTSATTCPSGQTAATYVTLAMSAVPPVVLTLPGVPVPSTLSATATVRTQ